MPRRPTGSKVGGVTTNPVKGSAFDNSAPAPLILPRGIHPEVRKRAQAIIDLSPHLEHVQIPMVIRLAEYRRTHDLLQMALDKFGPVDMETGKPNGILDKQIKVAAPMAALERSLALTVIARKENVPEEQRGRSAQSTPKRNAEHDGLPVNVRSILAGG